ncbi:MAG: YbbR-like domain-containing protein [Nitrospiraceae bacterium]|nr:MAG: YbbR-like domain-containing protein [Nitrospiraceae bacterium]
MKEFFTTNVPLKLASLIVAVALWFFVMLSGRSEITMDIPVVFTEIPERFEVVEAPKTISVTIEGQERLLKYLQPSDVSAVVSVSEAKTGRSFFTISQKNISLPKSFLVTSIDPETISLTMERQLKKIVSVRPHIVGIPEKGFRIANIIVDPESITLEGPASTVTKIDSIKTEPIDINGINSNLVYKANLNLSAPLVKKNLTKVDVKLSVEKILKENPQ